MIYFLNLNDHHKNSEIVDLIFITTFGHLAFFGQMLTHPTGKGTSMLQINHHRASTVIKHIHHFNN